MKMSLFEHVARVPRKNPRQHLLAAALSIMPAEIATSDPLSNPDTHLASVNITEQMSAEEMEILANVTLGERFKERVFALAEMNMMTADHVIFVGPYGEPLDEPVPLTDAAGYTPDEMTVSYQDGPPVGIPGLWSRPERARLSAESGLPPDEITMLHVYQDLQGYPEGYSRIDVVGKNGLTPIAPDDTRTRMAYLFESFQINNVPEDISHMVRDFILGLAAEESRFNPDVESAAGAMGILQTMPDTTAQYEEKTGTRVNPRDLREQIHVAEYQFEVTYFHFQNELSEEFAQITDNFFDGDIEAFNRYFLVPLMINAYNAGQGTMTKVVEEFFAQYTEKAAVAELLKVDELHGYDLYLAMSKTTAAEGWVGNYGQDSSSYFFDVAGFQLPILASLYTPQQVSTSELAGSQSDAHQDRLGSL